MSRQPLLRQNPLEEQQAHRVRLPTQVTQTLETGVTYGQPPDTGPHDFDYCFVFPLPNYYKLLDVRARSEGLNPQQVTFVSNLSKEARKKLKRENKDFAGQLHRRATERAKLEKDQLPQDHFDLEEAVNHLLKDLFLETKHGEDFTVRHIKNLESARSAAIGVLLTFFRRKEEKYYSYLCSSLDEDEVFLCVRMMDETAKEHAIRSNYPLMLDEDAVKDPNKLNIRIEPGPDGPNGAAMVPACAPPEPSTMDAFKLYPAEADKTVKSQVRKVDNIRLLYDRVTDILDLDLMVKWNLMKVSFPLHSKTRLEELHETWASPRLWWSFEQPVDEIRDYFGETVALYFVFVQHVCLYTFVFVVGSMAMMLANFAGLGFNRNDILGTIGGVYGPDSMRAIQIALIVVWILVFQRHLARKHASLTARWSCRYGDDSEVKSFPNPSFSKMTWLGKSDVDENLNEFTVSYHQRRCGRAISAIGTVMFVAVMLMGVGMTLYIKAYLLRTGKHMESLLVSCGVTLQIKIHSAIWKVLCEKLTDFEYHQEMRDYDASTALKSLYVLMINLYATFIYIAFFMEALGDDSFTAYGETPWQYLTLQMITTFGLYMLFSLFDLFSPLKQLWQSTQEEITKLKRCGLLSEEATELDYSWVEWQTKMQPYSGEEENNDYVDVLGMFGFVACFGITFPIGSWVALVYMMLQVRVDAWKLTRVLRRPWPQLCKEEWEWESIIGQLLWGAMITNLGFLVMYLEPWCSMPSSRKAVWFFGLLLGCGCLDLAMKMIWPTVSQEVELAARRRRRQIYQLHQYKKKNACPDVEEADMKFQCCGDLTFFHLPTLSRDNSEFESRVSTPVDVMRRRTRFMTDFSLCSSDASPTFEVDNKSCPSKMDFDSG